jgi:hypothetical protein
MFFFIFWGKKAVRRRMGYVADFCPVCRGPRPFQLSRVAMASHVFYIPLREEMAVAHHRICGECGVQLKANLDAYESIFKRRANIETLCEKTYPRLLDICAERFRNENKVAPVPDTLTTEERVALIKQSIMLMSQVVEQRFSSTRLDKETWLALIGTVIAVFATRQVTESIAPDLVSSVFRTLLVGGALVILWTFVTASRRFVARKVVPPLSNALKPLQPTLSEINAVLLELKSMRYKIGSKLRPEDLLNAIRSL